MPDPTPTDKQPTGWKPTTSTYGGGIAGAVTVVIVNALGSFGHPVDPVTASAITLLVQAAVGYLLPDGGRK